MNIWIGENPINPEWQHLELPEGISAVESADFVGIEYDVNEGYGGAANGFDILMVMAQDEAWPRFGICILESNEQLRKIMLDVAVQFAPPHVKVYDSPDRGETWVAVPR